MVEDNTVVTRTIERREAVERASVNVNIKVGHHDHRVADELSDRIAIAVRNALEVDDD